VSTFADLADACAADRPVAAVVLGSGLGPVARNLVRRISVSFGDVPGLPVPTVHGHGGRLTLGDWGGRRVLLFEGRVHRYEGHPWDVVVRPVAVAAELGARVLVLTNAAGGIRADLTPGSLMPIRDHLEWTRPHWWQHPGPGGLGPARDSPYASALLDLLTRLASELGITVPPGVYAQLTGPCYETPAEIRALRSCGADAVGMSTAREAQTARDLGMQCAAVSCITNRAAGLSDAPLDHREVLSAAATQAELLGSLLDRFLANLSL
jgi:purine-nucleoside phosphorylase